MSLLNNKIEEVKYLRERLNDAQEKLSSALNLNDLGIIDRSDIYIDSIHLVGDIDHSATISQKKLKCKICKMTFMGGSIRIDYFKIKNNGELYSSSNHGYFNLNRSIS